MEKVTYEQAKEAKTILIKYLEEDLQGYDLGEARCAEQLALLALTQPYFLD